jgi:CubicO group peptidase (beta-lactamase class C family)
MSRKQISAAIFCIVFMLIFGPLPVEKVALASNQSLQNGAMPRVDIDPQELESFLDEFIPREMERAHVPGLVIVVVQGDEVLLSKGYGYADIENEIPMTSQTAVRAGSVSKSLTATAVIQLVEQGILDLDAPVSDYIADIDLQDSYGQASTIRQLLNHMGGYNDTLVQSHAPDYEGWEPLGDVLRADLPPRAFAPGLVSSYSDWNFSLLGYAIEAATGKPYEDAIAEVVFEPLGMQSSTFTQPVPEDIFEKLAVGYGWNYSNLDYDIVPHDFVRMSPGIALVTNGEDMGSYMRALLNSGALTGNQIFDDEVLALLLERQSAAHPFSRGSSYAFTELNINDRQGLYKDGNGIGFTNRIMLMPDQDLGIFVTTNHRNLGQGMWLTEAAVMATRTLIEQFLENFVPPSAVEIPEVQPLPGRADHIERYTGHYQKAGRARSDFFKLEGLLDNVDVKDNGDGTLRIGSGNYVEVEPLVFQSMTDPGFFVIFIENQMGEIEFLTFGGTGSYQKVPAYEAVNTLLVVVAAILLSSISMIIIWPLTRKVHWIVWAVSLLILAFFVGVGLLFVSSVTDLLIFFKTIPVAVRLLFVLPWIIGVLALILLGFLLRMWGAGDIPAWTKIHYVFVLMAAVATVWLASSWNLML